jgi:hypothetical protein
MEQGSFEELKFKVRFAIEQSISDQQDIARSICDDVLAIQPQPAAVCCPARTAGPASQARVPIAGIVHIYTGAP